MRYLAYVCTVVLTINAAYAQDTAVPETESRIPAKETAGSLLKKAGNFLDSVAEEMVENGQEQNAEGDRFNAFGVPETVVGIVESKTEETETAEIRFPDCGDELLMAETRRLIDENQLQKKAGNIYESRRRKLIAKNIKNFENVDISSFKPQDNYEVADRMITLKINEKVPGEAFRICKGNNELIGREIFLLMYPQAEKIAVEILNFSSSEPLRFFYVK